MNSRIVQNGNAFKALLVVTLSLSLLNTLRAGDNKNHVTYSLKECIDIAMKNNIEFAQKASQLENDYINLKLAIGNVLPSLNGEIFTGERQGKSIDPYTNSYVNKDISYASYALNTNMVIWNGGNKRKSIAQARLSAQASELELEQDKRNLAVQVILAYLQVLNNEELVAQAQNRIELSKQEVERLELMYAKGAAPLSELNEIKVQLSNDLVNKISAQESLDISKSYLCDLMNIDETDIMPEQLPESSISDDTMRIPESNYETMPIIKASGLRLQCAEMKVRAIRSTLMPSLYFSGAIGSNYSSAAKDAHIMGTTDQPTDGYVLTGVSRSTVYAPETNYYYSKIPYETQLKNNFSSMIGVGLQMPILNGASVRSRVRLAELNESSEKKQSGFVANHYKRLVGQARKNYISAHQKYVQLALQLGYAGAAFHSAEAKFRSGAGTTADYVLSKNVFDKASSDFIASKYDVILKKKIADIYNGGNSY